MDVIATAGHVDHGKSTLVRALTGMEPDRWAEERRRGMTIDLGYAWTALPSGREIAFVDVPGHARFIGNMLAGVGPVAAALFVVAADEGWQQQSEEHLAALDAFGVQRAVVAVSRSDRADPAWAAGQAQDRLARTGLADSPVVAVSGRTGMGLDALRAALDQLVAGLPPPDTGAPVRLWIDRAFPIRGAGTVVTGTLGAGTLRVGDELVLFPDDRQVRVRALQSLKRDTERVSAVARVAVNLRGVDHQQVSRGQALLTPGGFARTAALDVRTDPTGLPARVQVHIGSAALAARLRPLGARTARLTFAAPLPLHVGDRLLVRDPGRHDLVRGAVVLDVDPPALARRGAAALRARELDSDGDRPGPATIVRRRGAVRRADLRAAGLLPAGDAPHSDAGALGAGVVSVGPWLVDAEVLAGWRTRLVDLLHRHDRDHPLDPGLSREAARRLLGLPDPLLLDAVADDPAGRLRGDRGRIALAGAAPRFAPPVEAALAALVSRLTADPFSPPEAGELAAAGLTPSVLAAATRSGRLVAVGEVHLLPGWPEEAIRRLSALPQPFTASAARSALGTTRRVVIPVLEALDRAGRTRRIDDRSRTVVPTPVSRGTVSG